MDIFSVNKKSIIAFITLLCLNFLAIYLSQNTYGFAIRVLESILCFILFLKLNKGTKGTLLILIYSFFIIPEMLSLGNGIVALYMLAIARIIRHVLIIIYILSMINYKNKNRNLLVIISFVVLLNIYLAYIVLDLIKSKLFSDLHYIFMIAESVLMLILGFLAALYGQGKNTEKSKCFMIAVFAFIFADVFFAVAFYANIQPLFYLDSTLFLIGLIYLLKSTTILDDNSENLNSLVN